MIDFMEKVEQLLERWSNCGTTFIVPPLFKQLLFNDLIHKVEQVKQLSYINLYMKNT